MSILFELLVPLVIGPVLIVGGARKLLNAPAFKNRVAAYELKFPIESYLARVWGLTEFGAGLFLLLPIDYRYVPASLLISAASGAVLRRVAQGANHDCGCSSKRHPIGPSLIVRNIGAIALLGSGSFQLMDSSGSALLVMAAMVGFGLGYLLVGSRPRPVTAGPLSAPAVLETVRHF